MKYALCLCLYVPVWLFGILAAPILPLLAKPRDGGLDNNHTHGVEPRLPVWLAWLDTPDNSLYGDAGHKRRHPNYTRHMPQVFWLWRNAACGLCWTVLAHRMKPGEVITTNGALTVTSNGAWQYKCGKIDIGWLLDDSRDVCPLRVKFI